MNDITSRVMEASTAVLTKGFLDGRAGKNPASDTYFAIMAVKALYPEVKDRGLLIHCAEGLRENYMIGYEGGLNHGEAT